MNNYTLATDFYELTMAQTYFKENKEEEILYFDLFYRKNPFDGGYVISSGLSETIEYIKNFKISEEEIIYLRSLSVFEEDFLKYLSNLKFEGEIKAVPDGTCVFPNEPVLTVKAPAVIAQLIETSLLTNFNYCSLVATSAKRIVSESRGVPVLEFGARRARGIEGGVLASKEAYIAGCAGTSNTYAGMKYNIPVLGTMAHSLVTKYDNEYDAFLSYAKSNPNNCIFLIDTYDTLNSGIINAVKVAKDYLIPNGYKFKGVRIDSGDLAYLSKMVRNILDEEGFIDTQICVSNGLNENTISSLFNQGACINSIGAGDNITAGNERIGGVYKLVAVEENTQAIPRIKLSNDIQKIINPGAKKVFRFYDKDTNYAIGDIVALNYEEINESEYTFIHPTYSHKQKNVSNYYVRELLVPIFVDGKLVYDEPSINEVREYSKEEFDRLYPEVKRIINPHEYTVDLSDDLRMLKNDLIDKYSVKNIERVRR